MKGMIGIIHGSGMFPLKIADQAEKELELAREKIASEKAENKLQKDVGKSRS